MLQCFTCGEWFVHTVCTAVLHMWRLDCTLLCVQCALQCFKCGDWFAHCCVYCVRCSVSNVATGSHIAVRTVCTAVLQMCWTVCTLLYIQCALQRFKCGKWFAHCCTYSVRCSASHIVNGLRIAVRTACTAMLKMWLMVCALLCVQCANNRHVNHQLIGSEIGWKAACMQFKTTSKKLFSEKINSNQNQKPLSMKKSQQFRVLTMWWRAKVWIATLVVWLWDEWRFAPRPHPIFWLFQLSFWRDNSLCLKWKATLHAVHLHWGHADRWQSSILSPVHSPFVAVSVSKIDWILRTHYVFIKCSSEVHSVLGRNILWGVTALQHMHQHTISPTIRTPGLNSFWLFYYGLIL